MYLCVPTFRESQSGCPWYQYQGSRYKAASTGITLLRVSEDHGHDKDWTQFFSVGYLAHAPGYSLRVL